MPALQTFANQKLNIIKAKASLEFARVAFEFPEDLEKLSKAFHKVMLASNKAEKTMYLLDW